MMDDCIFFYLSSTHDDLALADPRLSTRLSAPDAYACHLFSTFIFPP